MKIIGKKGISKKSTRGGNEKQFIEPKLKTEAAHHSMALDRNSINLLPYCSGSHVDMPSTFEPYFTVFAAFAACFFTPYSVSTSIRAMK